MTRAAIIAALLVTAIWIFIAGRWSVPVTPLGQLTCDDRGNLNMSHMLLDYFPYPSGDAAMVEVLSDDHIVLGGQIDIYSHCVQPAWDR